MTLPRFYQIIDDANWLERFLPLGLKLVQLRIKDKPAPFVRDQIKAAKSLCDGTNCQLIINDYWQVAIDQGCDFIHLGQEDLVNADLKTIKAHGIKFGLSTHDKSELQIAIDTEPNYIALGPVYHTTLKAMKWKPQGVEKVERWKQRLGNIPLVAIGGLTVERAPGVYEHGADSICVVTDVLLNENPEKRLEQWLQISSHKRAANTIYE
jgi:thiamine-phosphate pyrophosphorylase